METKSLKNPQAYSWFKWLIVWSVLGELFSIYRYLINPSYLESNFPQTLTWEMYLRGGISLLQLSLMYKIWKLSKMALYVYIATTIISYVISIATGQIGGVIFGAILLALIYWKVIKPIWGSFK